jgi:Mn2+/Fe2+ NRAMP family transporter
VATRQSSKSTKPPSLLSRLSAGLITGAADDDPSGIATYSQVGAKYGYATLWTMCLALPLMIAISCLRMW